MKVILFLICIGLWWVACRVITSRSPWGKLAEDFRTTDYVTLAETTSAQATVTLIHKGMRTTAPCFSPVKNNVYIVGRDTGVLFCGPWIGQILKLNRNFFIPWDRINLREEKVETAFSFLNGSRYTGIVETAQGQFEFNLDEKVVAQGRNGIGHDQRINHNQ